MLTQLNSSMNWRFFCIVCALYVLCNHSYYLPTTKRSTRHSFHLNTDNMNASINKEAALPLHKQQHDNSLNLFVMVVLVQMERYPWSSSQRPDPLLSLLPPLTHLSHRVWTSLLAHEHTPDWISGKQHYYCGCQVLLWCYNIVTANLAESIFFINKPNLTGHVIIVMIRLA